MTPRNILVLDKPESPWRGFLEEFFEDTSAKIHFFSEPAAVSLSFSRFSGRDLAFVNPSLFSLAFSQKLKVLRENSSEFRLFRIGPQAGTNRMPFDDGFENLDSPVDFQKRFVQQLPLPETIRVLVIDDETEIAMMVRDFLEQRVHPSFQVQHAVNGQEGLVKIHQRRPDVVVLDIKMPVKDGREVYREIKSGKNPVPVIIFFDAISGEEMVDIHKIGKPAVVEKGAREGAMPEMVSLIKKMVYFG